MSLPSVAVIDIGSNSIKLLVATRAADGTMKDLRQRTIEARISAGIGGTEPRLGEAGMSRGIAAIRELLAEANPHRPSHTMLVATSAVRDASNGVAFRERIRTETGHEVRLLSGDEEANLIGRGLLCDPSLGEIHDFVLFDLGGGSLEILRFRDRAVERAESFPLGCVRMAERFAPDLAAPLPANSVRAVHGHVAAFLNAAGFPLRLPTGGTALGTGGSFTAVRSILAAEVGQSIEERGPDITPADLRRLLDGIGAMTLEQRLQVPGLPAGRADIFPVALAIILTLAELGGYASFRHSFHNLRWGVAAELLQV